jgi:hypothetical protein
MPQQSNARACRRASYVEWATSRPIVSGLGGVFVWSPAGLDGRRMLLSARSTRLCRRTCGCRDRTDRLLHARGGAAMLYDARATGRLREVDKARRQHSQRSPQLKIGFSRIPTGPGPMRIFFTVRVRSTPILRCSKHLAHARSLRCSPQPLEYAEQGFDVRVHAPHARFRDAHSIALPLPSGEAVFYPAGTRAW